MGKIVLEYQGEKESCSSLSEIQEKQTFSCSICLEVFWIISTIWLNIFDFKLNAVVLKNEVLWN